MLYRCQGQRNNTFQTISKRLIKRLTSALYIGINNNTLYCATIRVTSGHLRRRDLFNYKI